MGKKIIITALLVVAGTLTVGTVGVIHGDTEIPKEAAPISDSGALLNHSPITSKPRSISSERVITAYSSRVKETDSTPFITASGTTVRDGVVAVNWLPIGTKVRIPKLFGDKVFIVEDRMAEKNKEKLDIWFKTTEEAIRFGMQKAQIEIL